MPIVGDNLGRQTVSTKKASEIRKKQTETVKTSISEPRTATASSTTSAKRQKIAQTQEFESSKPEPIPEPTITSGKQLRIQAVKDLSGHVEQYKKVDTNATYVSEHGEKVSGQKLKLQIGRNIKDSLLDTTKIKPSMYVESGGQQYRVTSETRYLIEHAEPRERQKLISSFGKTGYEGLPLDFVGPVRPPSVVATQKAYGSLTEKEKEHYGYTYTPFIDQPVEEWKYHPGGKRYLEEHKSDVIDLYIKRQGVPREAESYYLTENISSVRSGDYTKGYMSSVREQVWNIITKEKDVRKSEHFAKLPFAVRWGSSMAHAGVVGFAYPITLAQTGTKYVTGKGELTDPLGRIQTGKTVLLPDVASKLQKHHPGGPSGGITTVIGEGILQATGTGRTTPMEQFLKDPASGFFATIGEVTGMYYGGKSVHVGKVGFAKGVSKLKLGISTKYNVNLPNLSAYKPSNLIRTAWWRGKEKLGFAKYVPEEQVWAKDVLSGSTKFAEAKSPSEMMKLFERTRGISESGDVLGIHTAGHRFPYITKMKVGTSESPGLSVSAYGHGSPHFLRVDSASYSYTSKLSLLPQMHLPTAPVFHLSKIFRLPKAVRFGYEKSTSYLKSLTKGKYGHLAPKAEMGGLEIEAIIAAGTRGVRSSKYYFTTFRGHIIPLPHYKLLGTGMGTGNIPSISKMIVKPASEIGKPKFFSLSYQSISTTSLISPGYIFSSALSYPSLKSSMSSKSSYPSFPSYPSKASYPSVSSYPSKSSYPSFPSYPSKASYPSVSSSFVSSFSPLYYFKSYKSKKKKQIDPFRKFYSGYRERTWKVPTMKDFMKGVF